MISKNKKSISLILDDDFIKYCDLNNIEDTQAFAKRIFNQGFSIIKYGEIPNVIVAKEKIVEKIVEVIKEVQVEKIVEVIKEVPVITKGKTQIVTKEVIVEKFLPDIEKDKQFQLLVEENQKLTTELNDITTALNKMGKAKYLKNSDITDLYGE